MPYWPCATSVGRVTTTLPLASSRWTCGPPLFEPAGALPPDAGAGLLLGLLLPATLPV